ncbi:uncharacterized protein BO66DRAFT_210829 [Aspergillus aculeatinus CBS 121060]|uniref:Uncharacterized protein n=1 Tax=Aspergillus aculeatinus CBS 121060 TaxID=1448322 RepID=A0ACD1GWA2_9EURO|nr:hypothetical protein BO66DRAFT_210829 [Aspergillus aculeatinus CBS 121060]RAH65464.1 hypothetical protein BO66DRAFT_210829 [Aspergillus aculeatinus CBS 121060]
MMTRRSDGGSLTHYQNTTSTMHPSSIYGVSHRSWARTTKVGSFHNSSYSPPNFSQDTTSRFPQATCSDTQCHSHGQAMAQSTPKATMIEHMRKGGEINQNSNVGTNHHVHTLISSAKNGNTRWLMVAV